MNDKIYDNEMKGSLWFQDKSKRETDRHPMWKGKVQIEGKIFYFAGWGKTLDDGRKLINLSVEPAEAKEPDNNDNLYDDDVPF